MEPIYRYCVAKNFASDSAYGHDVRRERAYRARPAHGGRRGGEPSSGSQSDHGPYGPLHHAGRRNASSSPESRPTSIARYRRSSIGHGNSGIRSSPRRNIGSPNATRSSGGLTFPFSRSRRSIEGLREESTDWSRVHRSPGCATRRSSEYFIRIPSNIGGMVDWRSRGARAGTIDGAGDLVGGRGCSWKAKAIAMRITEVETFVGGKGGSLLRGDQAYGADRRGRGAAGQWLTGS